MEPTDDRVEAVVLLDRLAFDDDDLPVLVEVIDWRLVVVLLLLPEPEGVPAEVVVVLLPVVEPSSGGNDEALAPK